MSETVYICNYCGRAFIGNNCPYPDCPGFEPEIKPLDNQEDSQSSVEPCDSAVPNYISPTTTA